MINKIIKRIHSNYHNLFKFIFYIRYLFGIFFIFTSLFFIIPKFLDHKTKIQLLKSNLKKEFNIDLRTYEVINYNIFPTPHFEIVNSTFYNEDSATTIKAKNFFIYTKIKNIYNFSNLEIKKINFNKSFINVDVNNFTDLIRFILNQKKKFIIEDLNLNIQKQEIFLVELKKLEYSNFGFKKNSFEGEIFERKFKSTFGENNKNIKFKLYNTGIIFDIKLNDKYKNSANSGLLKAKVLDTNLKFNFDLDENKLKIFDFYFRNKYLSFDNKSLINYKPFFEASADFIIKNIDTNLLKSFEYSDLLKYENFLKNLNMRNSFILRDKKLQKNLINNLNLKTNLAYGRLDYTKSFLIKNNKARCSGNINLFDEFPILNFKCSFNIEDKKKFLKEFSINYKNKNESINIESKGYINIKNNKINFNSLKIGEEIITNEQDLIYFKNIFQEILFNEGLIKIIDEDKIKQFINEVL